MPRSDCMAQWLVLSIDVCRGLGISPLRINIWLSFSSGRSWPNICLGNIFSFLFFKFATFFFQAEDGIRDVERSRGLGDVYKRQTLLPNLKKLIGEASRFFFAFFLSQQSPNVFVSDAWPAPAAYDRLFSERCDQRVGRSP